MAFNFPSAPTVGQVSNGYVWNGTAWVGNGNLAAVAPPSDTPPANPVNGQLWYETDTGDLYLWYVDANTSQWVQISGPGLGDAPQDDKNYVRRNGVWVPETGVIQMAAATPYTTYGSNSIPSAFGDTIMQITEGAQLNSLAFTPKRADSRLRITAVAYLSNTVGGAFALGIFANPTAAAVAQSFNNTGIADAISCETVVYDVASGSTTARIYSTRAVASSGSVVINGTTGGRRGGGALAATLVIEEYV